MKYENERNQGIPNESMTLRDWFAGQALTLTPGFEGWGPTDYAQHAYAVADAMLKTRESNSS